jgi:molecular chaperone HtpG
MLEKQREGYRAFWGDFGPVIKEGIWYGEEGAVDADELSLQKLLLFETTHGPEPATLAEYKSRMQPDQKAIWYLTGDSRAALEGSPHLEAFQKRGLEVLFLTDAVDEWLLQRLHDFEDVPLKPIDRGDLELESASEKEARESLDRQHRELLSVIEQRLASDVKTARFSTRLVESPAAMVDDEHGLSAHMERLLRAANQDVPRAKRILELNPDHALTKRLIDIHATDPRSEGLSDLIDLVHGQALLQSGDPLPDAARFARLVTKLVTASKTAGA